MNGLTLVNELSQISLGSVESADEIIATGREDLVGTVVATGRGRQINWSNGTTWFQGGPTPTAIGVPWCGQLVAGQALVAELPASRSPVVWPNVAGSSGGAAAGRRGHPAPPVAPPPGG
jgi:hypothetical protein